MHTGQSRLAQQQATLRRLEREHDQAQSSRALGWGAMGVGLVLVVIASGDLVFVIGVVLLLLRLLGSFGAVVKMRARRKQIAAVEQQMGEG